MRYKINAYVEPHYPIKRQILIQAAENTLLKNDVKIKAEVAISVIGDRKMKSLNREYRGEDSSTDVLAFPYYLGSRQGDHFPKERSKYLNLGDIMISYPKLLQKAVAENTLVDDMARFLVVHGMLHLLGFDHEKDEDAKKMENLEDEILSTI